MSIKKNILATLTYFNMFDYPLKKREIFIFLQQKEDPKQFDKALNDLIDESAIFKLDEFYCLFNNYALADRRKKGNEAAAKLLKKADKAANFIAAFPFVKGVAISGSLSKKFADENADIDFFIITKANRLWLARTFLHLFKKLTFLFNMQDYFCMNYFIDEASLCILEKNVYTAIEVCTILPVCGMNVFENFYAANNWTKSFLPNNYMHISAAEEITKSWFISIVEKLFDNHMGSSLDTFFMKLTTKRWNKKTLSNKKNAKGILLGLHTGKHFSKPNPEHFQRKLLQRYENCLTEVFDQYEHSALLKNKFS